jgi:hypothetical protein
MLTAVSYLIDTDQEKRFERKIIKRACAAPCVSAILSLNSITEQKLIYFMFGLA